MTAASATELVRLKSGAEVRGEVTRCGSKIRIQNATGTLTLPVCRVQEISGIKVPQPAPPGGGLREEQNGPLVRQQERQATGQLEPEIDSISTGLGLDVRPIVGPDRRYVFLELRLVRTHGTTFQTFPVRILRSRVRRR